MSRDHRKLQVFQLADALAVDVYAQTRTFPREERYGLTSQLRRAAVSVPTNIVEGCARTTTREYLHFVTIALGSASEVRYLLDVSRRLEMLDTDTHVRLDERYAALIRSLQALVRSLTQAR